MIITALSASGLAAQSGLLSVGDKLISVDDSPLPNDPNETARRLRACRGIMRIGIKPGDGAPPPPPPPSGAAPGRRRRRRRPALRRRRSRCCGAARLGDARARERRARAQRPAAGGGRAGLGRGAAAAAARQPAAAAAAARRGGGGGRRQLAAAALDQFGADAARAAREAAAEYEVPEIADAVVEAVLTARVRAIADWEAEANELLRKAS